MNLDVLKNNSLKILLISRMSIAISFQMLTVAIGWQVYSITEMPLYLGLVGLIQFLPMVLFTFLVGYVADNFDRRKIISISLFFESVGILILTLGSFKGWITKDIILILVFFIGSAHAFQGAPMQALLPNIVDKKSFPRATAIITSAFQFAVIVGPSLGGILYAFGPQVVYLISAILTFTTSIIIQFVSLENSQKPNQTPVTLKSMFGGMSFIKSRPVILGAISLDLFAVLFGGATALLPVYAGKILLIGPAGLGVLRSAPAVGALMMSLYLAKKPLKSKVGYKMFIAVIFFGVSTIVFAISKSFIISMIALFVLGASDVISMVVRSTLVQLHTPDHMRGRVSSVNQLFIGTSNQLGEFESGTTAALFGVVPAVFIGGIGTIIVVILWMRLFPQLVHIDKLESINSEEEKCEVV